MLIFKKVQITDTVYPSCLYPSKIEPVSVKSFFLVSEAKVQYLIFLNTQLGLSGNSHNLIDAGLGQCDSLLLFLGEKLGYFRR